MKGLQYFVLLVPFCLAENYIDIKWNEWKSKYNKLYSTVQEEADKRAVWEGNLEYVETHNNDVRSEFKLEMNRFADQVNLSLSIHWYIFFDEVAYDRF